MAFSLRAPALLCLLAMLGCSLVEDPEQDTSPADQAVRLSAPLGDGLLQTNSFNLALGKPAFQSSTRGSADASRAVDGNIDGNWAHGSVTHTNLDNHAWWQVNLGALVQIGKVVIYNRTDCCGERLADFDLQFSPDGINWQTVSSFAGPASARTTFFVQANARFVRVRLQGTNYLSLAEVEVYGP